MRYLFSLTILSLLISSCNDLGTMPVNGLLLNLDNTHYSSAAPIPVSISNPSQQVFYLETMCANPHFEIDHKTDSGWVRLQWQGPLRECATKPFPLNPGESSVADAFISDSGSYRLMLRFRNQDSDYYLDSTYSKEFVVR